MDNTKPQWFVAKRQRAAGKHQGKWCVYTPNGKRLVVCEGGPREARLLVQALNLAADCWRLQGFDWCKIFSEAEAEPRYYVRRPDIIKTALQNAGMQ